MRREANRTPWNTGRAMLYGAIIGIVAAFFRLIAPWGGPHSLFGVAEELAGASLAFALLCGIAAALRNFVVRRLIWPEIE